MKILPLLTTILLCTQAPAQILNRVKDRVTNKAKNEAVSAKNEAKYKAKQSLRDEVQKYQSEYDSTAIDNAILLSDNSGMFGGRGHNEFGTRFMRMAGTVRSLYKDADLDDEENARLNLQMGKAAYAGGKYMLALKRLSAAKDYFERAYLTTDPGYFNSIAGLGLLFTSMGRYAQAEQFTVQALELRKKQMGPGHSSVTASMNNYAVLHYSLGKYNEAEKEFTSIVSMLKTGSAVNTVQHAIVLNNQAILFQSIGRYDQGVTLLKQALDISLSADNIKARHHLKFFSNLALLYQQMGKLTEAEEIYRKLEPRLERGKPEFANFLNNVAILALLMKKEDKVEQMLKQSATIYKETMTENSPAYAKVISDLGNFYRYKGRYAEAEPLLQQALSIRQQTLGENHPLYVQSAEDVAILHWKKNEISKAAPLYRGVMEKTLEFINGYFPPMSESEKTRYWDMLSPRFERYYNFAIQAAATDPSFIGDLFSYRLATKGLLLSSSRKVSETILNSGNTKLISDYSNWLDSKEHLMTLYTYSREDLQEQGINLDSLEKATNEMEKRLSQNSKDFADFFFARKTGADEVRNEMKTDEALIEIIRLRKFDQVLTDQCRYIAIVITKNNVKPVVLQLENGSEMEGKIIKNYRVSMKNKAIDEQTFKHFWAPLDEAVKGKKKIYFSPDGIYNQVNLYTLKSSGGDYLIQQYDFILIGNPRDLVLNKNKKASATGKSATLLGFPDYGSAVIEQLPGTKVEVDAINKLLAGSGYKVEELLQQQASETNLKATHDVSVLHIATHGYFLKDAERASWPIGVHADYAKDNVLLRSGLMLTGAAGQDHALQGLDNNNNGIITSYEAMNMNLKGTRLVVLSACETGLGEIKSGEGVYGLQRAFLAAGAEAIIMSLWKVDDAATQQLMNHFYANWIKSGNRQKAFKEAQLQLMQKFKEPLYWGAFVMMEN